jgi:pilus assembly protein CpaF
MSWSQFQSTLTAEQFGALLDEATQSLSSLSLATLRNRQALAGAADQALAGAVRRLGYPQPDADQRATLIAQILARIGGLGFLDGLMPPASFAYTDVLVNGDGSVWGRRKGEMTFDALAHKPSREEVWRAVEALLSPQGRACTEATPSVDAKLPRDRSLGFGGARVKVLHPAILAGDALPPASTAHPFSGVQGAYHPGPDWGSLPLYPLSGQALPSR